MDLKLTGGSALVTGAANGIGRAVAEQFAKEGCEVRLWDQSSQVLEVAREISDTFSVATVGKQVDLAREGDVFEATREVDDDDFSPLRYVVHAAAIGSGSYGFPFSKLEPSDWHKPMQVNMMGLVHLAHAVTPSLVRQGCGSFVVIGSVAGQIGSQTDPPYSATKAATLNFTQCMARDLAKDQIRVNMVCPGMVKTELNQSVWRSWLDQQPESETLSYEEWAESKIKAKVPLGRWQTPGDIANMVLFLSSDLASEVTGQIINVDGGYVMHW